MEDYLCHYNILGAKWGLRRFQYKDGSLTPAGRERYRKNRQSKKTQEKLVTVKDMSDDELNKAIQRLETENKYSKLITQKDGMSKKKSVEEMADDELSNIVKRLENEEKYLKLTTSKVEKGKSVTETILEKAKDTFISTVGKEAGEILAKRLVNAVLGDKNDKNNKNNKNNKNDKNK